VKQVIEKIIDFVTITVHPKNTVNLDLSEDGLKALLDSTAVDIEKLKRHLVELLVNQEKQSDLAFSIPNVQSLLIRLSNNVFVYQQNCGENSNLNGLYSSLGSLLVDVLDYTNTYFPKYFDIDQAIPEIYYFANTKDFQQPLNSLHKQFQNRPPDLELIAIITSDYLIPANGTNNKTATFRDLMYKKELVEELLSIDRHGSVFKTVKEVLLYMNFNQVAFFKYLVDKLQEEYSHLEMLDAKLELLRYHRKLYKQIYLKPDFAVFHRFPSIKDQVLNWIEEEIVLSTLSLSQEIRRLKKKKLNQYLNLKLVWLCR
jgi:hypothetical protein